MAAPSVLDNGGYAGRLVSAVESVRDPEQRADLEVWAGHHLERMLTAAVHATLSREPKRPTGKGTT